MKYLTAFLLAVFLLISGLFFSLFAQEEIVKAEEPVLVTSCGQSPGPNKIKVFLKRDKYDFVYDTEATAQTLIDLKNEGKQIKSLIIVTGASLKGMGAAGISIEDELARTKELIAEAKKQEILIIGAHVEGMERRAKGAAPGDNTDELSIDTVCPEADVLFIKSDGDEDGRFTTIATAKKIPMISFEMNLELGDALKKLYGK